MIYVVYTSIYNVYFHPLSRFPGPKLWQSSYLFRFRAGVNGSLEEKIKSFHQRYGPVVRYSPTEISFTSAEAWHDIYGFKERPLQKDPSFYSRIQLSRDGSDSIFTASEEHHPRVRKALSYAFSEKALRDQEPYVKTNVDLLLERLREKSAGGAAVDLVTWYHFTTFDVVGSLAIAQSFDCLKAGKYHEWVNGFWNTLKLGAFVRAMSMSMPPISTQLLRYIAPKKLRDARQRHLDYVGRNAEKRIAQGVLRDKPDFISFVLEGNRHGDGQSLSPGEIEANANFLLMAGTETVATVLSGTTYYMLRAPDKLQRAIEEVRAAFQNESEITFITASDRLPFLMACILEGLRLYPPGPLALPRRTPEDSVTMIAGHPVPGGVTVGVHAWSASHSPDNFYRPTEFNPERWLPGATKDPSSPFHNDHLAASQPFSAGARNCLGRAFAKNELRLVLARMLWNFDLELSPESIGWEKQRVYTLWDKGPLMVKLTPARK